MTLDGNEQRSANKAVFWIIGGFAGLLLLAVLLTRPGVRTPVDQALIEACNDRYAHARSHGDTILADAWIPRPDLQRIRQLRRCSDVLVLRH